MKNIKYFGLALIQPVFVGLTIYYYQNFAWILWGISLTVFSLIAILTILCLTKSSIVSIKEIESIPQWKLNISRFATAASIGVLYVHEYYVLATLMAFNWVYSIWFNNYLKIKFSKNEEN